MPRSAGFYQAQYTQLLNFMTFDRELSSFIDGFAGVRLWLRPHLGPLDELRVELKVDGFRLLLLRLSPLAVALRLDRRASAGSSL